MDILDTSDNSTMDILDTSHNSNWSVVATIPLKLTWLVDRAGKHQEFHFVSNLFLSRNLAWNILEYLMQVQTKMFLNISINFYFLELGCRWCDLVSERCTGWMNTLHLSKSSTRFPTTFVFHSLSPSQCLGKAWLRQLNTSFTWVHFQVLDMGCEVLNCAMDCEVHFKYQRWTVTCT